MFGNMPTSSNLLRTNTGMHHAFNQTRYFMFKGQEEQFKENKKTRSEEMKDWEDDSIIYTINNLGYRSDIDYIECDECNVYLGCSYTFGEEVKHADAWPSIVNKNLDDYKLYNLGIPGGGPETCYRVLKGFIGYANIKRVFLLLPVSDRREIYFRQEWYQIKANTENIGYTDILSGVFSREEMYLNNLRNLDAIKFLCVQNNIPLYMLDVGDEKIRSLIGNDCTARDLLHPGFNAHRTLANMYLNMVDKNQRLC